MKLGVISQNFNQDGFEKGLQRVKDLGFEAIEVGAAGLWAKAFCNADELVKDKGAVRHWLDAFARHDLEISALGAHGAPLTPDKKIAGEYSRQFRQACKLMEMADLKRMTLLSGLPEGAEGDTAPNWVAFAEWPALRDTLDWQWEKRLLPYWREHGKIAADHGVTLCFEMHGGDMIHNPIKVMRLREEIGPVVACNFDYSHMWYQGIDPCAAVSYLGDVIQHVHAKDIRIHHHNARLRGMMDTTSTETPEQRSWNYTVLGMGHNADAWTDFITTLRLVGYDHVLSIECESEFIDVDEGLIKSVEFLSPLILRKPVGAKWWEQAGLSRAGAVEENL